MECPKCKTTVTEEMHTCPNCKKVLKLVCPKCKTINKTNTCKKCGFVIISKCHKCGKINQTINGKCSKCGFSTFTSVAINSSNIDEFACLTLEFPNLNDMKSILGSTKLSEKFKVNLDNLLSNYAGSIGTTREIIENAYIIRFNKNNTFKESARAAINAALEIQKLITNLNYKLNNAKNALLDCKIAILKRDINSKPEDYKSGFDIKLIYENKKELRLINCLQVITDASIYEQLCEEYDLNALSSTFIKGQMIMFFELNLKKYIKIQKPKENKDELKPPKPVALLENNQEENEINNKLYNINSINFDELKCSFANLKTTELTDYVVNILGRKNQIVSIKGKKEYHLSSNLMPKKLEDIKKFNNIYRVTCYDEMKYKPYGFFHELISGIYNFSLSPRNFGLNKFEIFDEIDDSGFMKSLINLMEREYPHPEDVRYSIFDIILNIFEALSNSLIYIENIENIDDTSYEILNIIFEKLNDFDVSYLITSSNDFSLHKNSHFLLSQQNYSEICIKPISVNEILEKESKKFAEIIESYYFKTIVQNTKGSLLYFNNSIEYLLEKELLNKENNILSVSQVENAFLPPKLSDLIVKRLQVLSQDKEAYKMLSLLIMLGPKTDLLTIKNLQIPNEIQAIQKLNEKNYTYVFNNSVYIQNYKIIKKAFFKNTPIEDQKALATELIQKVFNAQVRHPKEAELYKIIGQGKNEFIAWEQLSRLNASMGDFSAYLNCSVKLLKLLDNHVNESSEKTIEEYKMEVYENISNLLYKYTPNEVYNISKIILENLEKTINDKKIVNLCNKMLQGCLISGNYSYAIELIHKILSKYPNASLNPKDQNFNISYFLISLIKIEVLFSIGNLKECEEATEEILNVLNADNLSSLRPQHFSDKQFKDVIIESMTFGFMSKVILLRGENEISAFNLAVEEKVGESPLYFKLSTSFKNLINGEKIDLPSDFEITNDKFSKIILNILKAFNTDKENYSKFANDIYQAKINAKLHKLTQIELICDLLIGYSYFKLGQNEKASAIYYNILESSTKNGLKLVTYIDWYLISMLKLTQEEIDVAFGIANNAIIQLEKDANSSDFLFLLFRELLSEILTKKGDDESAQSCLKTALFIKQKYELV